MLWKKKFRSVVLGVLVQNYWDHSSNLQHNSRKLFIIFLKIYDNL